jgi:hypothetical protein
MAPQGKQSRNPHIEQQTITFPRQIHIGRGIMHAVGHHASRLRHGHHIKTHTHKWLNQQTQQTAQLQTQTSTHPQHQSEPDPTTGKRERANRGTTTAAKTIAQMVDH